VGFIHDRCNNEFIHKLERLFSKRISEIAFGEVVVHVAL
jgi:hypothetical protein